MFLLCVNGYIQCMHIFVFHKVYSRQFCNIIGSVHVVVSLSNILQHATHGDSALASLCKM